MTSAEQVAYLKAKGWQYDPERGSQPWLHPSYKYRSFSLDAAIDIQGADDAREERRKNGRQTANVQP